MKHNYLHNILFIILLIPAISFAIEKDKGKYEKSKSIKKEYTVDSDALLRIDNRYGNVDVTSWDKNQVVIEVKITVSGNNEEKVVQRLKMIDVRFDALLEIKYEDKELKVFGYLSSLVDEKIHNDKNKMEVITNFLLLSVNEKNKIIEYILNLSESNNLKSNLHINLLFEMYRKIKKDSIENCMLASRYENYFKSSFENKVIKF